MCVNVVQFSSMRNVDYVYFTLWQLVPPAFIPFLDAAIAIAVVVVVAAFLRNTFFLFIVLYFFSVMWCFFFISLQCIKIHCDELCCMLAEMRRRTLCADAEYRCIHTAVTFHDKKCIRNRFEFRYFWPVYVFAYEINTFFLWLFVSIYKYKKKQQQINKKITSAKCVRLCSASDVWLYATFSVFALFPQTEFDGLWRFRTVDWWYFTL